MPTLRWCGGVRITSLSPNRILPLSGLLKPAIAINNVVLPEPDGPSRVRNSPLFISRSTESSAYRSPYFLVRLLIWMGRAVEL